MDVKNKKSFEQIVTYNPELDIYEGQILSKSKADKCEKMIQKFGADEITNMIEKVQKQ